MRGKHIIFGLTFPAIIVLDVITKRWALDALVLESRELFGGLVPLTLAFNKGAAFGLRIGEDSRWFFVPVTVIALILLGILYRQAADRDFLRIGSISLVVSGAMGNLYDRVRWDRGVVDFLGPIDLGFWDFPIFNVADMAITCGAVLLAVSFWLEEQGERARERAGEPSEAGAADSSAEGGIGAVEPSADAEVGSAASSAHDSSTREIEVAPRVDRAAADGPATEGLTPS